MIRKNWIDKTISYFDPMAGARRIQARMLENSLDKIIKRKFEGASNSRRTQGWFTPSTSANGAAASGLQRLRDRSRDLVRNNSYAERAIRIIASNTIGTGILAHPFAKKKKDAEDLKFLWSEWAESTDCDADGVQDIYGIQNLVMRCIAESGEVLIRRRRRFASDGYAVPIQLQVLEPDFLDTSRDGQKTGGGFILQGIEYDAVGKRRGYWLFSQHPGEILTISNTLSLESKFVAAEDILHLYRVDRAGQVRGIPFGAPCIVKLRDFDEYEDAQLVRQKIAACFAGFVQDIETPADPSEAAKAFGDKLEPGAVEILPPGKTITFPNVPTVGDDGHSNRVLRAIAVTYGVTYEGLTGDYSQVNFSSGRMGWLEFQRNLDQWQWQLMVPRFCIPVWRWFREAAMLEGYKSQDVSAKFTPPRREMIDPTKEIPAQRDAIRAGFKTLSQVIRENGYEPDEMLLELKSDFDKLDKSELILDSDPRKVSRGGNMNPADNPDNGTNQGDLNTGGNNA